MDSFGKHFYLSLTTWETCTPRLVIIYAATADTCRELSHHRHRTGQVRSG